MLHDNLSVNTPTTSSEQCQCINEALLRISNLRKIHMTFEGEIAFVHNKERKWAKLFADFILGNAFCNVEKCIAHSDDMLWYVLFQRLAAQSFTVGSVCDQLMVYRRQSPNKPNIDDTGINWEETVCINLILGQLDFHVTCAVCTKTSPQNLQILRKNCQTSYCTMLPPQVFKDVVVRDGECVCVELVTRDRYKNQEAVVFLGSIRYEILKQVYDTRASKTWNWAQKFISCGRRLEFVRMKGPHGKGYAEMAVGRLPNTGYETPLDEEPPDFGKVSQLEQRRMSETNLSSLPFFSRPPSTPSVSSCYSGRSRRWQSEADTVNQCLEVEAGGIGDELEEGILGRLRSVRGFGQAWHWLREKRRNESTPLNVYLTYITLPWSMILDDLLADRPRKPILTFDLNLLGFKQDA
ncbi:unnamed protein product [Enterobius vermicularis]|uniref:Phospholipid scramblase n=1 Tax=Enterobius vermicularis TaxID=51028 RepID=A0A0N4VFZ1_ENTVE|nr:unnamed protein product [Enterobius vermicularis]